MTTKNKKSLERLILKHFSYVVDICKRYKFDAFIVAKRPYDDHYFVQNARDYYAYLNAVCPHEFLCGNYYADTDTNSEVLKRITRQIIGRMDLKALKYVDVVKHVFDVFKTFKYTQNLKLPKLPISLPSCGLQANCVVGGN